MNNRNKILLAALIVQLVLIAWVYWPGQGPAARGHQFFPDLSAAAVRGLTITDDKGGQIRLAREGQAWSIQEARGAEGQPAGSDRTVGPPLPADTKKVEAMVKQLTDLESTRLVTRTKASQTRLKVAAEEFVRKIEIALENGEKRILYLGSSPSFKNIHARADEENEVYLAKGLNSWEAATDLASWWQTDYLDVDTAALQEVAMTNAYGSFRLERAGEGPWRLADAPEGEALSQEAVQNFLHQASFLSISTYLGREQDGQPAAHGLNAPAALLELGLKDRKISLRVGPEEKEGAERVVKSTASPFYVRVPEHAVKPLLEQTREGLTKEVGKESAAGSSREKATQSNNQQ